ncbi:hypothetical protein O1611_g1359 [Lasiodiplodia mahajangana]|uniref:Uncharacterized protein n=1 Tax=Lasiodiplodia mahajangana TaxID=1108764 RepID=A0ACC2JXW2_9PEZI|nr:hypothetical protein O1611_g1359 [Lasiodiplodia mahajangana]
MMTAPYIPQTAAMSVYGPQVPMPGPPPNTPQTTPKSAVRLRPSLPRGELPYPVTPSRTGNTGGSKDLHHGRRPHAPSCPRRRQAPAEAAPRVRAKSAHRGTIVPKAKRR